MVESIAVGDLVELLESVPKKDLHKGSVTRDLESILLTVFAHEHVHTNMCMRAITSVHSISSMRVIHLKVSLDWK